MKTSFKLAYRNLWRNPRRTLIIGSSILFSSLFCILMTSFVDGSCNYIIDKTVEQQTGMFQMQHPDYWDDKRTDNYLVATPQLLAAVEAEEGVASVAPRISTFAMAWNGNRSRNISLQGIDVERERRFSGLDRHLLQGQFLADDSPDRILIGHRMSEIMSLSIGDTLTLIGQGYHGESAYGLFVVGGIVRAVEPMLDAGVVYMPLSAAQHFITMENGATYLAVTLHNKVKIASAMHRFSAHYPDFAFHSWEALIGDTVAGAANDKKQMMTYIYFLYLIVGFGLLSTVIMLTNERLREFGVMMALGTKRGTLIGSLFLEITMVAGMALAAGVAISLPLIVWLHYSPLRMGGSLAVAMEEMGVDNIIPFDLTAELFWSQALVVLLILLLVMLYPLGKIRSMSIINALKD